MAVWERQTHRPIPTSFSSSLLESIYHSIDNKNDRKKSPRVEEDAESLRRAIMIENRHFPSNSSSSTDSTTSSSSSTETTDSSLGPLPPVKVVRASEPKSTSTKSRAHKIYGDLKKAREPSSPGGRIASFLNSIFNPRSLIKSSTMRSPSKCKSGSVIKSRSVNETKTTGSVMKSRSMNEAKTSCLSRTQFSRSGDSINNNNNHSKSKRAVRFCPDEDSEAPRQHPTALPSVGSLQYTKKNIDGIRLQELMIRDCYYNNKKNRESDFDEMSCASSDLFELEANVVVEELPVYGSTSFRVVGGELVM